jgi:membrane protein implicated in regulation of membrane protease activity
MHLDKLVLIIVCVSAVAAAAIWLGVIVLPWLAMPLGWIVLLPVALAGYIFYRVIAERVGNAEEDHYDRMDH